jgi:hypothetical protein
MPRLRVMQKTGLDGPIEFAEREIPQPRPRGIGSESKPGSADHRLGSNVTLLTMLIMNPLYFVTRFTRNRSSQFSACGALPLLAFLLPLGLHAGPLPLDFDLTKAAAAAAWQVGAHDCRFRSTADGLAVTITGSDPYFSGPLLGVPTNQPLRLVLRLRSEAGGVAQVFAHSPASGHDLLADFSVPRGQWKQVRLDLPALSPAHRLRLDPPGETGVCVVATIRFEAREEIPPPQWPTWVRPEPATGLGISNRVLQIFSHPRNAHALELRVSGQPMAFVNLLPRIACLVDGHVRWTEVRGGEARRARGGLSATSAWTDTDGVEWKFSSYFRPVQDRVEVNVEVRVNHDREVLYLPLLQVFAGVGSFGAEKQHALLAGLEYLDNEPSSSELDIVGPGAKRQVPAAHQITFPLMAVQAAGRYVALAWNDSRQFCALFDSPDRIFGSGGHVMGVLWPESDGENRSPGSLFPKSPRTLKAGQPLRLTAWILAGAGDSVVPAIQQYVRLRGLPKLPDSGYTSDAYAALMAEGWLKSKIRVGDRYRHAWAGEHFGPAPAADAAVFETWLAPRAKDAGTAQELRMAATAALAEVGPRNFYQSGVGHVHTPVAPLVFGHVSEAIEAARASAHASLSAFDAEGRVVYHAAPNRPDFSKGHWAPDANGLTATVLTRTLEGAAFAGDPELIKQSTALLRRLDKFHGTAPRGAQTWEIPLHTPDILASAYLVRAYVTGYELTGDRHFLDEAIYWAWTGVPFVYLVNPTGQPVGSYATIAVLGATHWKAPNWMGLPVQWCGMVYADALYRLTAHDGSGPWRQLADGITASGIQQTYPPGEANRAGLLPDSFVLRSQHRNPPDINPATVGISAVRLYTQTPLYDFRALRERGLWVHAPGQIEPGKSAPNRARVTVRGWPQAPYFVLVNGLARPPQVRVNGKPVELTAPNEFRVEGGQLILQLSGWAAVELGL